jgi:putative hydrolase of the HAD superfamily
MTDKTLISTVAAKKAVIFDLFHTLTSLESTWGGGTPMTCEMLGVSREAWDEQLQQKSRDRLVGRKQDAFQIVAEMARAIDPTIPDERIRVATTNRIARFAAALQQIPDETLSVLECLKSRGKRIGLISNADVMEVAAWSQSKVAHLFDSTIFSCVAGCVKPEKEIYELSLSELGVSAAESAFVGDGGSNELEGARAVGMTVIMIAGVIRELWPDRIAERRKHADFLIEQLRELIEDKAE